MDKNSVNLSYRARRKFQGGVSSQLWPDKKAVSAITVSNFEKVFIGLLN